MTGADIISVAITLFVFAAGSLFNNLRISDLATDAHAPFDDTNRRIDDLRDLMGAENARTQDKLDAVLKMLTDLGTRVTRLEE